VNFGTWAIFPQLREISLTIDLDASHYMHSISVFHLHCMCLETLLVKQRIIGKRHRGTEDSLMVTSMCDVRNCDTSQQVVLINLKSSLCEIYPFKWFAVTIIIRLLVLVLSMKHYALQSICHVIAGLGLCFKNSSKPSKVSILKEIVFVF